MEKDVKEIQDFFDYDLKIKKLLNDIMPAEMDFYDMRRSLNT